MKAKYYVVRNGPDRYDLRQSRFAHLRIGGNEHPHDLMAVGFSAAGMLQAIEQYFPDSDASVIDRSDPSLAPRGGSYLDPRLVESLALIEGAADMAPIHEPGAK